MEIPLVERFTLNRDILTVDNWSICESKHMDHLQLVKFAWDSLTESHRQTDAG